MNLPFENWKLGATLDRSSSTKVGGVLVDLQKLIINFENNLWTLSEPFLQPFRS